MADTILITGGLGYIGSHTVVCFANAGYNVVIVDNLSNSDTEVLNSLHKLVNKKLIFYKQDLGNINGLETIFSQYDIKGVIHFAAYKAVGESCIYPFKYYNNNITNSLNLFKVMEKYGVKHIIFSSSATVYDTTIKQPPFTEDTPLQAVNPYGTTKIIIEKILCDLVMHKGWHALCLRYFNPIGAHPSRQLGDKLTEKPQQLLPAIYKSILDKEWVLSIWGNDYDTPDGSCIRDFVHVMDVAEAHLIARDAINSIIKYECINIGTGKGTSVLEVIDQVEKITNKNISYHIKNRRSGDIPQLVASVKKTQKILGRKTKYSITEGIRDGWNFIRNTTNEKN